MKSRIAFLVTHGTDTMAWGLSYLNYTLKDRCFNIALVGSQIPLEDEPNGSDGYLNLETAVFGLSKFVSPRIFVAMNSGKMLFENDVWKTDKWDTKAFDGNILLQKQSNELVFDHNITIKENSGIDILYVIKTGGTIEQSMNEHGVLAPDKKKDAVTKYLQRKFDSKGSKNKGYIGEIVSYSVLAEDSSDLTIEYWKKVAKAIEKIAKEADYNTKFEDCIADNVATLFASPLHVADDYKLLSENKKGVVFIGYGGGNVNIKKDKKGKNYLPHSPMGFFEEYKKNGGLMVLSSHPTGGILDPLYENGRVIFDEKLAIPAMDFSIARCAMKLSCIIYNTKIIKEFVNNKNHNIVSEEALIALLFLSGANFPKPDTRQYFENLWQIRIPEKDLLIDNSFQYALKLSLEFFQIIPAKRVFKKKAVIFKPDANVGCNFKGEDIDAAKNIVSIIQKGFNWDIETINLNKGISFEKIDFSKYVIIFGEGGRQSVYNEKSFAKKGFASQKEMLTFYKKIIKNRASSVKTPPGIFICLSHQLIAQALFELIVEVSDSKVNYTTTKDWQILITEIRNKYKLVTGKEKSAVRANEDKEEKIVALHSYIPTKGMLPELIESHKEISEKYSGLIEDLLPFETIEVSMLHGDEVSEAKVLFINWALMELNKFKSTNQKTIAKADLINFLPVGIEITSSTSDLNGKILTEAASCAIYYIDNEGYFYRDFSFQFHPELLLSKHIREVKNFSEIELSWENDGLRIFLTSIMACFEKFKIE